MCLERCAVFSSRNDADLPFTIIIPLGTVIRVIQSFKIDPPFTALNRHINNFINRNTNNAGKYESDITQSACIHNSVRQLLNSVKR